MKVLVTGSKGFIGKNLIKKLNEYNDTVEIMEYDKENSFIELEELCEKCDVVFHLAAVLRPETVEGYDDNVDLTSTLLKYLIKNNNKCPLFFSSSIQAELDNPYGQCKRIEESKIIDYGKEYGVKTYVFRFPNLFGIMSKPNYTSVVSTFCCNTVKGLPIIVNNPSVQIKFAFIEDVLEDVINTVLANNNDTVNKINEIKNYYPVGLGELVYYMGTLKSQQVPMINRNDDFYSKLQYTYNWFENNIELFD